VGEGVGEALGEPGVCDGVPEVLADAAGCVSLHAFLRGTFLAPALFVSPRASVLGRHGQMIVGQPSVGVPNGVPNGAILRSIRTVSDHRDPL
jgi:hypothetical protein